MPRSLIAALTNALRNLRYSYLALPGAIALALSLLAVALTTLERAIGGEELASLFPAGPPAARAVLATIGTTLATVVGVAFSITIVSLQLVSQQYTPRAVRGFLGDRLNQAVAGIFIGGFLYALITLRTIEEGAQPFVPRLSVTIGVVIAFVALGSLLVFVHHMGHSIDVANIVGRISEATRRRVDELYPESYGEPSDEDPEQLVEQWHADGAPAVVYPDEPGFVQALDDIPTTISGESFRVELLVAPGDFVTQRHPLANVWTDRDDDECVRALRRAIAVAPERDIDQDVGYGVRQLADIAVKALSPSVNDPTTATTCIGYLQDILERLARRDMPPVIRHFPERKVVLVMRRNEFSDYLEALVQIGRYATADARVVEALLNAAARIAQAAAETQQTRHARSVSEAATRIGERALAVEALDNTERRRIEDLLAAISARTRVPAAAASS